MSLIKICDICGKELPMIQDVYNPARYRIERIVVDTTRYDLDLCSPCMKEMTNWIKANTKSKDELCKIKEATNDDKKRTDSSEY